MSKYENEIEIPWTVGSQLCDFVKDCKLDTGGFYVSTTLKLGIGARGSDGRALLTSLSIRD